MRRATLESIAVAIALCGNQLHAQISYPVNFRFGVEMGGTRRNISVSDVVTNRLDASLKGIEAYISPASGGVALGGRILDGSFGGQKLSVKEARVFLGQEQFQIQGAYGQRSLYESDTSALFIKVGARSMIRIGGSGVAISIGGSKYFTGDFSHEKSDTTFRVGGWEGESNIYYSIPRLPVFVQLGYRTEYFTFRAGAEHVSGLLFGTGFWLGGR